jgi:enterobactin synthetase component D
LNDFFLGPSQNLQLGGIVVHRRYFDKTKFIRNSTFPYDLYLPKQLEKAVVKRQAEFIAGRVVACDAIRALGERPVQLTIGNGRAPVWPEGIIGSISHNEHWAVAVAEKIKCWSLGVDVETWISDKLSVALTNIVGECTEIALLKGLSMPYIKGITLLFSGKESLFKALYPIANQYFDFSDSKVISWDEKKQYFILELSPNASTVMGKYMSYQIFYHCESNQVLTLAKSFF